MTFILLLILLIPALNVFIIEAISLDDVIKEADECLLFFYITTKIQQNKFYICKRDAGGLFVSF